MNKLDSWYQNYAYPSESWEEAKARYISIHGPIEEDIPENPNWEEEYNKKSAPVETEEPEEGFLDSMLGGNEYLPSLSEFGNAAFKSVDETQASGATIAETLIAPSLDYLGFEETANDIKEWAPGYREEQLAQAAKYPEVQTKLQKRLAENPDYVPAETRDETLARLQAEGGMGYEIAKYVPDAIPLSLDKAWEDSPTAGEVGSFAAGSAVPALGALAAAAPAMILGAPALVAAGLGMGVGTLLGSALVSSETAENVKNNPIIRRALGISEKEPFERLSSTDQQLIKKISADAAQSNLGNRIISSGIPEMIGYIPAGGWLLRAVADIAGGTASEVWDISVSRDSMISALRQNGVDPDKLAEFDSALEAIGPKKSEVFMKALVGEAVATGPIVAAEQLVINQFPKKSHQVDVEATVSETLRKEAEASQKLLVKMKSDEAKSLSDSKAKRQNQVDDLIKVWQVDPDAATQMLGDFKIEGRAQNDIIDILSAEHPEILNDIAKREGDQKRRQELEAKLEKSAKAQTQALEKQELKKSNEAKLEAKTLKKEEDEKFKYIDAQTEVKAYEEDYVKQLDLGRTDEQLAAWDKVKRPVKAIKILDQYNASIAKEKTKADDKVKADAKAKEVDDKAKAQAEELSKTAEAKAKEDTDKAEVKTAPKKKADLKLAEAKLKEAKAAPIVEVAPEEVVEAEVAPAETKRQRQSRELKESKKTKKVTPVDESTDPSSPNYVLEGADNIGGGIEPNKPRVVDLTDAELKREIKTARSVIKTNTTKKLGLDVSFIKTSIKAIQNEQKRRETGGLGGQLEVKINEELEAKKLKESKKNKDVIVEPITPPVVPSTASVTLADRYNNAIKTPEGSLRIVMPETTKNKDKTIKSVVLGDETFTRKELQSLGAITEKDGKESYSTNKNVQSDSEVKVSPVVEAEEVVDINDEDATVPVDSLYPKNKERAEFLKEEYPEGMTLQDYRDDLQEIKQEQLDERDSDKDVDDYADELDARADKNFTKAASKQKKGSDKVNRSSTIPDKDIDLEYNLSKDETIKLTDDFVARTKLKNKDADITILSKSDEADLATLSKVVGESQAEEILGTSEAFVTDSGKIYVIAENIYGTVKAADPKGIGAGGRLIQTLFHEVLGHMALKKFLGAMYNPFINRFIKTNKKALDDFAINGKGRDYLPKAINTIENADERREAYNALKKDEATSVTNERNKTAFTMAEEYIAINFAEFGARDPNILKRVAASLRTYISSIPMFEDMGVTNDQVKVILAKLQQEYIGGKRNFITGEDFPVASNTPKDTSEEESQSDVETDTETAEETEAREKAADDEIETLTVGDKKDGPLNFSKKFITRPNLEKLVKEGKIKTYNPQYESPPKGKSFNSKNAKRNIEENNKLVAYYDPRYVEKFEKKMGWNSKNYKLIPELKLPEDLGEAGDSMSLRQEPKDGVVYRGMSDAEYKTIIENGFVQTKGTRNFGQKEGLTFFTTNLREASTYAKKIYPNALAPHFEAPVWIVGINEPADHRVAKVKGANFDFYKPIDGAIPSDEIIEVFKGNVITYDEVTTASGNNMPRLNIRWEKHPTKEVRSRSIEAPTRPFAKINMSKKASPFDKVLQEAETKTGSVSEEKRKEEAAKINARQPSKAYKIKLSKEYVEKKAKEGHGTLLGSVNMSKMPRNLKHLEGQTAVAIVFDRLMRGQYNALWGKKSKHAKKKFLGGGVGFSFDLDNKTDKGQAVIASAEGANTGVKNNLKELKAKHGLLVLAEWDNHIGNMDVWETMWFEMFDAIELGNFNTKEKIDVDALNELIKKKQDVSFMKKAVKLHGGAPDYKSLMELGDSLTYATRGGILNGLFGPDGAKSHKGYTVEEILLRTSDYPDAELGDVAGVVEFDVDNPNFQTDAEFLGTDEHRSYPNVLQGKGVIRFPKNKLLKLGKDWGQDWLSKESPAGQVAFMEKGDKEIKAGYIRDPEWKSYKSGQPINAKNHPKFGETITRKPSKKLLKFDSAKNRRSAAVLGMKMRRGGEFVMTPEMIINMEDMKVNKSKIPLAQKMNSYKGATIAQGRLTEQGLYWVPTFKWQDDLSNKMTKRLIAQGTLPDTELYKDIRRKNKGVVFQAQQAGEKLFKVMSDSKQQKVLYNFFVTPNADPTLITDPKERQAAIDAKAQIHQIGKDLVTRGLMTQESLEKFDDQYLPRKYLKYLLKDKDYRAIDKGGAGVQLDLGYLQARKDIPAGIRELILGEVKDPGFLSSIAISTPVRDMAILDMFESIAGNKDWILPSTLVKFDILGELKRLSGNDTELIKSLQLYDTGGVKVSGHWLLNEAERIRDLVYNHMLLSDKNEKLVRQLINTMTDKGKEILLGVTIPSDFKRIPKGKKYGRLSGMAIRKEIFEDMFGWGTNSTSFDINADGTIDASWAEKVLGTGGTFEQYNRLWKWSKVSANPPSWVRNFVSNLVFMSLGPVPMHRLPDLFLRSVNDQIKTRKVQYSGTQREFDGLTTYTKIADEMGLTSGGFSQAELKTIRNEFVSSKSKASGPMSLLKIRDAFKSFQRGTSDVYGGIDTLGKVMVLKYLMEQGSSKEVAAAQAEKFLFDYSNPLSSVKYLRKSAFGAPFLSYPSFVAPVLIETIIKRPWKFLPYIIMAEVTKSMFKEEQDVSDEEYQGVMSTMSDYLHKRANEKGDLSIIPESVLPLPHKDSLGRAQIVDVGYFYPWGMFSEIFRQLSPFKEEGSEITGAMHSLGLMGSPLLNIAVTSLTGRDPFTDRQIHDELATSGEKYASWFNYAFNLTLPPMFHGLSPVGSTDGFFGKGAMKNPDAGGFGALTRLHQAYNNKVGREGEPKFTEAQAWFRMVGLNLTPLAPFESRAKQVNFEVNKIKKLQRALKIKYMKGLQAQYSKEELKELVAVELERINRQTEKLNKRISKPLPASLKRSKKEMLKSREKYLKYLKSQKAG